LDRLYIERRMVAVEPYEDARRVLRALAQSYIVCAISNGEQDLKALGLADIFQFTVMATEVGFQKPDRRIFEATIKRAGGTAAELAHVGDSLQSDVAGAKAFGARAIWFNPSGLARAGDVEPDGEIRTLSELPDVLDG